MTVPATRRIVDVNQDDHSMSIASEAMPKPAANEVLIKVTAAGINRPDLMQRYGLYPPPVDASPVLGLEVSGEIVAIGLAVSRWKVGDKVCALCNGGGYADYTVAPATQCLPIPKGVSITHAAALPETLFTVWHNVFQRGKLKSGENFLVHGGSSGIGTTAIQLAKAIGANVYTTAGSAEKCSACEALGAIKAVNYKDNDFVAALHDIPTGKGMDVILDMVGGDYIQKDIKLAANDGRIVFIAFQTGFNAELNFVPVLMKRLTITASTLRAQSTEQKANIAAEIEAQAYPLIAEGKFSPLIDSVFTFEEITKAHERMESGDHVGKIVVTF
ncbi:Phthiocerol/phenolphthiocerol synthesis polyketide synthase type I PpsC [Zhongshania aliphaticivorans]|uniref:Phthiocerol/phenolphthiocerol synthesis polyketide synthase type I PpsC n=1 Tax=Zhongshania aliphaticivorans TaxID=1470434 RepID=A0A5S9PFE9_9GAMM|nr:NAD(P)H-quinone oxidoreductase [Zhongshania aliphaticivorans]CAA0102740.1 Phthiocerol/phenolphthiocerol synthesis polyketide synthase type I PpsC [Zhongshania aliphaticivorans]CAA0113943.1 Phthiocerol/phenolphthiocerol synthesis polyketide synthase type I PpsC [Zhongshania aliphaticivorans]